MGLFLKATDTFYSFRVLRLLTTPWVKTSAFKLGLLDDKGNLLRKPETSEERNSYTLLHRLVYNLKRLLNKLPLGKTTIASYIAALYLIKEESGISDSKLSMLIHELTGIYPDMKYLNESTWYLNEDGCIRSGIYTLLNDISLPRTGDVLALKNSSVTIEENVKPVGSIFGTSVYPALHHKTKQIIYITVHNITQ